MATEFKCPVCKGDITFQKGTEIDINDGITAYCSNKECRMADWGHGSNEKNAFNIFQQKCGVK
jgi:hypothetical protein